SSDAGASWTTVDAYNGGQAASALVCAPSGVFVAGWRNGSWVVRKSTDSGKTWKTVDSYNYPLGKSQAFVGWGDGLTTMRLHPSGDIYTAGWASIGLKSNHSLGSSTNYWVVRRGSNGGTSWQTVASTPVSTNSGSVAYVPASITTLGTDASGKLY